MKVKNKPKIKSPGLQNQRPSLQFFVSKPHKNAFGCWAPSGPEISTR